LVQNKYRVVPYDRIMDEVWGKEYSGKTESIRICIRRLRKKLQDSPPNMLINERSRGYMLKS